VTASDHLQPDTDRGAISSSGAAAWPGRAAPALTTPRGPIPVRRSKARAGPPTRSRHGTERTSRNRAGHPIQTASGITTRKPASEFGVDIPDGRPRAGRGRARPSRADHQAVSSSTFGQVHPRPRMQPSAGSIRCRLPANGPVQTWKACWVQALGGSNPPSSATLISANAGSAPG
jgi:hypothetical protein